MAYDERLAERVRDALVDAAGAAEDISERRMFGGLCFMLNGNMSLGVHEGDLIVRFDPGETDAMLAQPHTRPFDLSGARLPPRGWGLVAPRGTHTKRALAAWVKTGLGFARSLPPK